MHSSQRFSLDPACEFPLEFPLLPVAPGPPEDNAPPPRPVAVGLPRGPEKGERERG
jgi:hypothetical protein